MERSETQVAINPPAAWLGARNAILWGKATQYRVANFRGPLSIKSVVRGSARWSTSEAERIFHELGKDGTVAVPLEKTFWAARFGMLVDRFGIPWLINCEESEQPAER